MNPTMQLATLIVALLGLVVASVSLTWYVVQFFLGGSRPKIHLVVGALAPGRPDHHGTGVGFRTGTEPARRQRRATPSESSASGS